jgi:hypothetical protein
LAGYYRKSPDRVSEEELRAYFLYLKNVKKISASTFTFALCGIKEKGAPCAPFRFALSRILATEICIFIPELIDCKPRQCGSSKKWGISLTMNATPGR